MTLLFNQALQAHQNGRTSEAEALYRKIIFDDPKNFDALHMLGIVCSGNGKTQDADKFFRTALSIDAGFPPCHVNYGFCLLKQKRFEEAIERFDNALALFPSFAEAWFGRGNALRELNRPDDAIAAYNKALALKPNLAEAHAGYGTVLAKLDRYDEALTAYNRAFALKPGLEFVEGERLHCKMRLCDWSNFGAESTHLISSIKTGTATAPFGALAILSSPEDQLRCVELFSKNKYPASDTPMSQHHRYNHDRIRIAYLSADFRDHPVSQALVGVFEHHDRKRFETIAVSFGPEDQSEMRTRLKGSFDQFIDVNRQSDLDVAKLLQGHEVDIVVDLTGYTANSRTAILAQRPSGIQVNFLGYPATMGTDYIDYLIADPTLIPKSHQTFYTEKIVYLPNCYHPTSYRINEFRRSGTDKSFTRAELGLPHRGFIFCCFNNNHKITPGIFDSWMRILKRVNESVLWLLQPNESAVANLRKEAGARGVSPERLVFAKRMSLPDHLARLRLADLVLDTMPYNAHTTANDALWVGVPLLTQIGETFAGRVAASLLNAVGLPELIAPSLQAYEDLAVLLATDGEKLAALKGKLASNLATAPLFNPQLFARHLEMAYTAMYDRHQENLLPDHIYLQQ